MTAEVICCYHIARSTIETDCTDNSGERLGWLGGL
jgi:hypothetical protein